MNNIIDISLDGLSYKEIQTSRLPNSSKVDSRTFQDFLMMIE